MRTPNREELALQEIARTSVSRHVGTFFIATFLLIVALPPLMQAVLELRRGSMPRFVNVFGHFSLAADVYANSSGGAWPRLFDANGRLLKGFHDYEKDLEDESVITQTLRGPVQLVTAEIFRHGNEKVYIGREGWLFYRPTFDYATGRPFLDNRQLRKRTLEGNEFTPPPQPDPRKAITQFREQLAGRGIALIIVPTPGKITVHPEFFSKRYARTDIAIQNPSFAAFKKEMAAAGVYVFDPAPLLVEAKEKAAQYLITDTHWIPQGMQLVADRLANLVREKTSDSSNAGFLMRRIEAETVGDIAAMLQLPQTQLIFPAQKVVTRQIRQRDGSLWQPDAHASILLLGDSFTNIYSLKEMGWGESAGFAEQLSFSLQQPLDVIARNDAGAHATRRALSRELAQGSDRLAGKKIVIWQFAARELAVGDWQLVPMETKAARAQQLPDGASVVTGIVKQVTPLPRPGSVPYREAIASLHLVNIESLDAIKSAVIYLWGMRDNKLMSAARLKEGERVTLRLVPWDEVEGRYGSFTRLELDDPNFELVDLPAYWAEEVQ